MSEYYYPFKNGITSVRLTEGPGHDRLEVWQRGGKCGELVFDLGTGRIMASLFCDDKPLLQTTYGGSSLGTVVNKLPGSDRLTLSTYLLSETGKVVTVDEVMSRSGRGKKP